jgi:acylphosphatase
MVVRMKTQAHVVIAGRVQGVWFRASTKEKADALGLTGWVKNTTRGDVEAVFEGEEGAVREMLDWCWRGPPLAKVTAVKETRKPFTGVFSEFSVLR